MRSMPLLWSFLALGLLSACGSGNSSAELSGPRPSTREWALAEQMGKSRVSQSSGWIAADFDGDGDNDLFGYDGVLLLREAGGFVDRSDRLKDFWWPHRGSELKPCVQIVDFQADGDLDILLGGPLLLVNDGKANFTSWTKMRVGNSDTCARLVDVDRDGDLDLYVGSNWHTDTIYFNDYADDFRGRSRDLGVGDTQRAVVADFNGDGRVDFLKTPAEPFYWNGKTGAGREVRLFLDDGKGKLVRASTPKFVAWSTELIARDFDRDGDLDIALSGLRFGDRPICALWINAGKGAFTASQLPATDRRLSIAHDVDGNKTLDLLARGTGPQQWWLNDGKAKWTDQHALPTVENLRIDNVADVNGDGIADLLGARTLLGLVNSRFARSSVAPPLIPRLLRSPIVVDVDGDGNLDLVDKASTLVAWNDGDGLFRQQRLPLAAGRAPITACTVGDLEGDGDLDIVYAICDTHAAFVICLEQTKPRQFRERKLVDDLCTDEIEFFDFEGDGDADLLADHHEVQTFVNDSGTFRKAKLLPFYQKGVDYHFYLADVNGDGLQDVWAATSAYCTMWIATKSGRFLNGNDRIPKVPLSTTSASFADIDGDGDQDLVCGSTYDWTDRWLHVLINDGKGKLTRGKRFPPIFNKTESLVTGDFDDDGDIDIVTSTNNGLRMYVNNGKGVFGERGRLKQYEYTDLHSGDFDGDGDVEILVASYYDGWSYLRNDQRTLQSVADPRAGATWPVELQVNPSAPGHGRIGALYMGGPLAPKPRIERFGNWFLDPSAVLIGVHQLPATGRMLINVRVPNSLAGRRVSAQAVVTHAALNRGGRFTNAIHTVVRGR